MSDTEVLLRQNQLAYETDFLKSKVRPMIEELLTKRPVGTPNLNAALALAQSEIKPPAKSKTARVQMKAGGEYTFDYADLSDLESAVRGPLGKNGLAFVHLISELADGRFRLTTQLRHASGESLDTSMSFSRPEGGPQALGSVLTYLKRYLLSALTSTSSEEDDDGNATQGNNREISPKKPTGKPSAPLPKPPVKPAENKPVDPPQQKPTSPAKNQPPHVAMIIEKLAKSNWTSEQKTKFAIEAFGVRSPTSLTETMANHFAEALGMTFEAALAVYIPAKKGTK